jgi:hypothetical protein
MRRRWFLGALATLAGMRLAAAQAPYSGVKPGEVLRGRFRQERTIKGFDRPLVSTGDFVLAPGHGLIWRTETPFAIITVITPSGLVQQVGGVETNRLSTARLPFLANLYDMLGGALSGDWHALRTQFDVTQHGDAARWDLVLVPRSGPDPATMPFRSITLQGGRFLDQVSIVRPGDDSDQLRFTDQALGAGGLSQAETALFSTEPR